MKKNIEKTSIIFKLRIANTARNGVFFFTYVVDDTIIKLAILCDAVRVCSVSIPRMGFFFFKDSALVTTANAIIVLKYYRLDVMYHNISY